MLRLSSRRWLGLLICAAAASGAILVTSAPASTSLGHGAPRAAAIATTPIAGLFAAPGSGALVTSQRVRVAVRVRRGSRLLVKLNGRDVSRTFGGGSSMRSALLSRRDGVRLGNNRLFALTLRGRRQTGMQARLFVVALNLDRVAVTRVGAQARRAGLLGGARAAGLPVTVSAGPIIPPGLLGGSGAAVQAALRAARTSHVFRAWLNGREVTRFFVAPKRATWTASLSPTHGVRFGANRIRTLVIAPGTGRYVSSVQVVNVPRTRPLAAAGLDRLVARGARLRLDGGRSLATRPGRRLLYRWRLVQQPLGSRAVLRDATSRRPRLIPDRPGAYQVQLVVTQVRSRAVASAGGEPHGGSLADSSSAPDELSITALPSAPLVDGVDTEANDGHGHSGIKIGAVFYPNPSPGGDATQVLTLNRSTLQPTGPGNAYTDGTDDPQVGIAALRSQIAQEGTGQLVIIAQPNTAHVPIVAGGTQAARLAAFAQIVNLLGGTGFASAALTQGNQPFSVIGVPYADVGSGWQKTDALRGSFTLTGGNYAFSPSYYSFDTTSESSGNDHTMAFPDLPGGGSQPNVQFSAQAGFHVVVLDHANLRLISNQFVELDSQYSPTQAGLALLQTVLTQAIARGDLVFMQSVGNLHPLAALDPNFGLAWNQVARDMVKLGANLGVFNAINGSYAFVGGAGLPPSEVAETSSAVPGQPHPSRLQGYFAVDRQGEYHPVLPDPTGSANLGLYKLIHQAPTPWPYTTGPDAPAYAAAVAYITDKLGFSGYGPDIRAAYYLDDRFDFTTESGALAALAYPGGNPGFTAAQFGNLKGELANEFVLLKQVQGLFGSYQEPFLRAQGGENADLQTLATNIQDDIKAPNTSVVFAIASGVIDGALLVVAPYVKPVAQAIIGAVTSAVSLAAPLADLADGSPATDRVQTKVADFSKIIGDSYNANATAMDALRDVIVSDYGKLQFAAAASKNPNWAPNSATIAQTTSQLQLAARQGFYGALIPAGWPHVFSWSTSNADPAYGPGECLYPDYQHLPRNAWTRVVGSLPEHPGNKLLYDIWAIQVNPAFFHYISPSRTVVDPLVTPINQRTVEPDPASDRGGLGLYLPWFLSRNFDLVDVGAC